MVSVVYSAVAVGSSVVIDSVMGSSVSVCSVGDVDSVIVMGSSVSICSVGGVIVTGGSRFGSVGLIGCQGKAGSQGPDGIQAPDGPVGSIG